MTINNMPAHSSVREFANRIADLTSLQFLGEREDSRVVVLGKKGAKLRVRD
jgi:wyosine [tRNA(Phe)-imidazoG37] synthetase (radical SAM superfamily)